MQKLSDVFEAAEKRRDARVYREIEFSLPRELTKEQNIAWAREFIHDTCVVKGMVAIMSYQFKIVKNPELVLSIVTSNHSTFTHKDIALVLNRYIDDPQQFRALYDRLTNTKELVLLGSPDC